MTLSRRQLCIVVAVLSSSFMLLGLQQGWIFSSPTREYVRAATSVAGGTDAAVVEDDRPTTSKNSDLLLAAPVDDPCTPNGLSLVRRQDVDGKYCRADASGGNSTCTSWTWFPRGDAGAPVCDFLCTQASESRPAIHKQSALRDLAAIAPSSDSACATQFVPPSCFLREAVRRSGREAEKPVSVLFIGHSHTRFLVSMLCMMLNATACKQFDDQFRNISIVRNRDIPGTSSAPDSIRMVFVQANYHFGNKVRLLQGTLSADDIAAFTHVVVSRGSWDLLFYDRDPRELVSELVSSLRELLRAVPRSARVILHMPHYYHANKVAAVAKGKRSGSSAAHALLRAGWRRRCFAEPRVVLLRDVNVCAAYRAGLFPTIELYDVYAESKTSIAARFVDDLGHHYQDVALEYMAMKLLRDHICVSRNDDGQASARRRHPPLALGPQSCANVDASGGSNFHVIPECACHHPTERRDAICRKYGRSVPDASRRE